MSIIGGNLQSFSAWIEDENRSNLCDRRIKWCNYHWQIWIALVLRWFLDWMCVSFCFMLHKQKQIQNCIMQQVQPSVRWHKQKCFGHFHDDKFKRFESSCIKWYAGDCVEYSFSQKLSQIRAATESEQHRQNSTYSKRKPKFKVEGMRHILPLMPNSTTGQSLQLQHLYMYVNLLWAKCMSFSSEMLKFSSSYETLLISNIRKW